MNELQKRRIKSVLKYTWPFYIISALLVGLGMYFVFGLTHRIPKYQSITLFVSGDMKDLKGLKKDLLDKYQDNELKKVSCISAIPGSGEYDTKLSVTGINGGADIIIVPASRLETLTISSFGLDLSDELINSYYPTYHFYQQNEINYGIKLNKDKLNDYCTLPNEDCYMILHGKSVNMGKYSSKGIVEHDTALKITQEWGIRSLPHNRVEVFFDLIKHRKMTLFTLSCFTFMFFIPLAVDLFYFNFLEAVAIENEKYEYLFSLIFYSMVIMLPCMLVGFIGFVGAFYTAKKIVWQEGVSVPIDFFQGIKENWKQALIDGMVFGIVLFGLVIGGSYLYIFAPVTQIVKGIGIGALALLFIFFGMTVALDLTQCVYYQNTIMRTMRNSFSFIGLLNWKVLVTFLLSTGVVVTLCCFNMVTIGVGLFLFALLNSVVIILYTLIAHTAFDKYINKEHYPDMVGKGLYKESKEA